MATLAYIFLAQDKDTRIAFPDQQEQIETFAREFDLSIDEIFIESGTPLCMPFGERPEGLKILKGIQHGDSIVCLKAEWILATPQSASILLAMLQNLETSLYCVDLREDLSLDTERKLVVSTGGAQLIQKLLRALSVSGGDEDRAYSYDNLPNLPQQSEEVLVQEDENQKFAGGPVPFGWQVDANGYLVEDQQQQGLIQKMLLMREEKASYRTIAATIREQNGIWFSSEGIRKLLKRQGVADRRQDE